MCNCKISLKGKFNFKEIAQGNNIANKSKLFRKQNLKNRAWFSGL